MFLLYVFGVLNFAIVWDGNGETKMPAKIDLSLAHLHQLDYLGLPRPGDGDKKQPIPDQPLVIRQADDDWAYADAYSINGQTKPSR